MKKQIFFALVTVFAAFFSCQRNYEQALPSSKSKLSTSLIEDTLAPNPLTSLGVTEVKSLGGNSYSVSTSIPTKSSLVVTALSEDGNNWFTKVKNVSQDSVFVFVYGKNGIISVKAYKDETDYSNSKMAYNFELLSGSDSSVLLAHKGSCNSAYLGVVASFLKDVNYNYTPQPNTPESYVVWCKSKSFKSGSRKCEDYAFNMCAPGQTATRNSGYNYDPAGSGLYNVFVDFCCISNGVKDCGGGSNLSL